MAFDRYGYVGNNPARYIDPSGSCPIGFPGVFEASNPLVGIVSFYMGCLEDVGDAIDAYQEGERRPLALYSHATGITDAMVSAGERLDQLNSNLALVFSNAPIDERLPAAVDVGWISVSTAANIIGVGQAIRGARAFSRSGAGGSDYFVEGTKDNRIWTRR